MRTSHGLLGVVCEVTDNLVASHDYVGPDGGHLAVLCGDEHSVLIHEGSHAKVVQKIKALVAEICERPGVAPLVWKNRTLHLGAAKGGLDETLRMGGTPVISAVRQCNAVRTITAKPAAAANERAAEAAVVGRGRVAARGATRRAH